MANNWPDMPNVVGAIDGTSHAIQRPSAEPERLFYSGHRHYHCLHTQIIIDNNNNICYIHSGFLGHLNDSLTALNGQIAVSTWTLASHRFCIPMHRSTHHTIQGSSNPSMSKLEIYTTTKHEIKTEHYVKTIYLTRSQRRYIAMFRAGILPI
jgi:hypothetical protein